MADYGFNPVSGSPGKLFKNTGPTNTKLRDRGFEGWKRRRSDNFGSGHQSAHGFPYYASDEQQGISGTPSKMGKRRGLYLFGPRGQFVGHHHDSRWNPGGHWSDAQDILADAADRFLGTTETGGFSKDMERFDNRKNRLKDEENWSPDYFKDMDKDAMQTEITKEFGQLGEGSLSKSSIGGGIEPWGEILEDNIEDQQDEIGSTLTPEDLDLIVDAAKEYGGGSYGSSNEFFDDPKTPHIDEGAEAWAAQSKDWNAFKDAIIDPSKRGTVAPMLSGLSDPEGGMHELGPFLEDWFDDMEMGVDTTSDIAKYEQAKGDIDKSFQTLAEAGTPEALEQAEMEEQASLYGSGFTAKGPSWSQMNTMSSAQKAYQQKRQDMQRNIANLRSQMNIHSSTAAAARNSMRGRAGLGLKHKWRGLKGKEGLFDDVEDAGKLWFDGEGGFFPTILANLKTGGQSPE